MGDGKIEKYDLQKLIKLGELDIREVAKKNMAMVLKEYFELLSKFLSRESEVMDALTKIANLESDVNDFRIVSEIKTLLEDIGCKNYVPGFNEIIDGGKFNDKNFAAAGAKKLLTSYFEIYTKIESAKKTESSGDAPDSEDLPFEKGAEDYEMHSLNKIMRMVDHEEATRKLRILAIDDAPVMVKTISAVLSDEYKVYGMTNPAMLEKFLNQITPELFLLDYQMPEFNGFDLIPIIRNFKEHKDTPIIFLTSMGTSDHVSAALTLGACDFIVKPFQGNILREKIAKHIVRKILI